MLLDMPTLTAIDAAPISAQRPLLKSRKYRVLLSLCLLLTCIGAGWFSYQLWLVPQPVHFTADWQNAQWVQSADGNDPVAYFRYSTDLSSLPDGAFVTITAEQAFQLYVNNVLIGSNTQDVPKGMGRHTYIYDVISALRIGSNVVGVRVANLNQQTPALRANFGVVHGLTVTYHGTGNGWVATARSTKVYTHYTTRQKTWTDTTFDASSWLPILILPSPPPASFMSTDPRLYERPLSTQWMSTGASHDAFFVRTFSVPSGCTGSWLRIVAAGPADIFINGVHVFTWNGQVILPNQQIANYLSDQEKTIKYRKGLTLGMYDLSSYIHAGTNTVAIHVSTSGNSAAQVGLDTLNAALSTDVLISDAQQQPIWITPDVHWHSSPRAVPGWEWGNSASMAWPTPLFIGRPGVNRAIYLPDSSNARNTNVFSVSRFVMIISLSFVAVIAFWLLVSLFVVARYTRFKTDALIMTCLAYLPALASEGLLIVLAQEPQLLKPFPYTWQWGTVLLAVAFSGIAILYLHMHSTHRRGNMPQKRQPFLMYEMVLRKLFSQNYSVGWKLALKAWLKLHWGLLVILLVAIPLSCYGLSYEPYWQDELTSYYAAKGILAHGLPYLPSGFLYAKGELYSYMLAVVILLLGDHSSALRFLSVGEYLISLPLFYFIAIALFNRRIALLATAMLALSPSTLLWSHEVRMYEQAQLLTMLALFLFYRALQRPDSPRRIYMAVLCLVADYLSHEEIFIILPTLVLAVLLISWDPARGFPGVLARKHWWLATLLGCSLLGAQLIITNISHPPVLGTDQSQQPLISFTLENIPYYLQLFFSSTGGGNASPYIVLNSLLAIAGGVWAFQRRDKNALYCSLLLWGSVLILVFLFTLTSDRYIYPLLPLLYLLSAYTIIRISRVLWNFAQVCSCPEFTNISLVSGKTNKVSFPLCMIVIGTMLLVCVSVFILPVLPLSNYSLLACRTVNASCHRHYSDYDVAGQYVQRHWKKGDVVIAVSPAISVLYYVGDVNYFFSVDRSLYLFEKDNRITDTPTGSTPLLSQSDFQSVLATHARVWIISDNGLYQSGVTKNGRFTFPPDMHVVYEGYGSAVYLREG